MSRYFPLILSFVPLPTVIVFISLESSIDLRPAIKSQQIYFWEFIASFANFETSISGG